MADTSSGRLGARVDVFQFLEFIHHDHKGLLFGADEPHMGPAINIFDPYAIAALLRIVAFDQAQLGNAAGIFRNAHDPLRGENPRGHLAD